MELFSTFFISIILLLVMNCSNIEKKEEKILDNNIEQKLYSIAQEYVKIKYPEKAYDPKYRLLLIDNGEFWRIEYMLPDDMIGGAPIVLIDKKTLKVIRMLHGQ